MGVIVFVISGLFGPVVHPMFLFNASYLCKQANNNNVARTWRTYQYIIGCSLSLEQVMSSIQLAAVTDLDRWRTQQQQGRCRLLSLAHRLAIAGIVTLLPTSPPSPLSVQSLSSSYSPCTGDDFEGGQF